jgi:hypothetical protein
LGGFSVGFLMPKGVWAMEKQKHSYQPAHLPPNLHVKLDPRNFLWITPALGAVVAFVLGVDYGIPAIDALEVIYDGAIVVLPRNSNRRMILCQYDEMVRGWKFVLSSAKLTKHERIFAEALFAAKIGYCWFEKGN